MKLAIFSRGHYSSPRILAETLKSQLATQGIESDIFFDINLMTRLIDFKDSKLNYHFWLKQKISYYFSDCKILARLKNYDAIIVCECTPTGFRRNIYNVEKLRKILRKPILYYEVYYLGNAPTQIELLTNDGDALEERYDLHLSVSSVTEIRQQPKDRWYTIGLYAKTWGLKPVAKEECLAIVDFAQAGYEHYRALQIRALQKAGIKYISLERRYEISEIRAIYQRSAIFFVQFPEAFGLPILECLCGGTQIFTGGSGWPMAFRLDEQPTIHGPGTLPACFTVYDSEAQLVEQLLAFKASYDLTESPKKVFDNFRAHYASYFDGNETALKEVIKKTGELVVAYQR